MSDLVFDSSALLAMLQGESGGERVTEYFLDERNVIHMSAVNVSEAYAVLMRDGLSEGEAWRSVRLPEIEIAVFSDDDARIAGALWKRTGKLGLSLGDRACVALGLKLGARILTVDRQWSKLKLGVAVEMIRG